MLLFQTGYECAEKIKLFYNLFFTENDDVHVSTSFKKNGNIINVYTSIFFGGRLYDEDYYYTIKTENLYILKKAYDAAVTKSFCHAASKIRQINLPWGVMSGIRPAKNVRELLNHGIKKEDIFDVLEDLYEVDGEKTQLAYEVAGNEKKVLSVRKPDEVSVYIGIPFCPTRCLYCSFVSTDMRVSGKYMDDYFECLLKELDKTAEIIQKLGCRVQTVYIGGGTPTTLSAKQIERLCGAVKKLPGGENLLEFTLEAGRPDTITNDKLKAAKNGGVNRISINPQTMSEKTLVRIGRQHTPDMAREAFEDARKVGFDVINTDLIAGLPGESFEDFRHSVDEVIKLNPENITVHSMCVKRSARLGKTDYSLADADVMNKMLSYTQSTMKKNNMSPYYMYRQKNISGNLENIGYAKPGTMSFYNINIMEEVQTIIAAGCGGSTKIVMGDRIERIFNFKDPVTYISRFDDILKKKDEILDFYK